MSSPFFQTNGVMPGTSPLISLVLSVRNGLPHLREALESVAALTYTNFELVVQDACSTDGTLELLKEYSAKIPMSLVSEQDSGIADGYYRAVRRCRGVLIGSIDADNLLESNGLEVVATRFAEDPFLHALYGSTKVRDDATGRVSVWVPPDFDLLRFMSCEVVPPFATSFFSRVAFEQVIGTNPDPLYPVCGDYAIWLALGHLKILRIPEVLGTTRLSEQSSSCKPEQYERMCGIKEHALAAFLSKMPSNHISELLHRQAVAGIYIWGAECLVRLGSTDELYAGFLRRVRQFDPYSPRLQRMPAPTKVEVPEPEPVRPDRAPDFTLMDLCGEEYHTKLEKNFYGPVDGNETRMHEGCLTFRPLTSNDHLATAYVKVKGQDDRLRTRLLSVDVAFPAANPEIYRGAIVLQDQGFNQIAILNVDGTTDRLSTTQVLPEGTEALRATFIGKKQSFNFLPLQLTVGVYSVTP